MSDVADSATDESGRSGFDEKANHLIDLLGRCALGDRGAFEQLYDQTSARLLGVLTRLMGRRDWAEEALQEAFVKIWMNASEYRPDRGHPMTWMTSIARYRGLDMLRKDKGEVSLEQRQEQGGALPQELTQQTLEGLHRLGDYRDLLRCLETLKPEHCQCLVLCYCEGYSHRELSERLSHPVGTVKTWIRRAGKVLKDCLDA